MDRDDYLMMSGIQHFSFCRRQWALIHLEQQWSENLRTVEGHLLHERCHDDSLREKRGDLLIVRGMRVVSHRLRLSGICDIVEFHADPNGITLQRDPGLWRPVPSNTNTAPPKQTMLIVCSFAPKPWLWKKCWSAIYRRVCFSMPSTTAASWWI